MVVETQFEEDVRALAEFLVRRNPLPPSHVRVVASAVVRKWLVDNELGRLANETGCEFALPALDTRSIADAIFAGASVRFFMTGGVVLDGEPMRGIYVSDEPFTGTPPVPIDKMAWRDVSPKEFLRLRRVYSDGEWFNTEQIIRFTANKCGGVHLDPIRDKPWQSKLERAAEFFRVGNPERLSTRQLIETRSPVHTILLVLPKEIGYVWTCLDIELLAAAQSLVNVRRDGQPLFALAPQAT